jgi:MOSC domain-containing protein
VRVESLRIHPVKSAKSIPVSSLQLEEDGPRYDRRWMVVGKDGRFVSLRSYPQLTLVQPHLENGRLRLSTKGKDDCFVPMDRRGNRRIANIINSKVEVVEPSKEASRWFSDFLGRSVQLVTRAEGTVRPPSWGIPLDYALNLADVAPVLVTTSSSLSDLNSRLGQPITMERFRANIVVQGSEPWEEDDWQRIRIGAVELEVMIPDARCAIVNVDPDTGARTGEPLRTLATFRKRSEPMPGFYFGIYCYYQARQPLEINESDPVEILRRKV